ncbi:MAG: tetratricopeptide repeat protein [Rhodospirillales bacterium]|nr:tetratricopeptide repeat protein [Rhodospirillales bacterium]
MTSESRSQPIVGHAEGKGQGELNSRVTKKDTFLRLVGELLGAFARLLWLALVSVGVALSAAAQPATESQEKEYDAAFQETLRQPGNLDVLFRFATVATQTGDLEGAVSALERMLLIDPNLPRVRLELGVLYFRLGSYELARTYLQTALASRNIPADVRAKADQYMAELDKRLTRSRFSGEVFLGMRYQSNANLGPGNSQVRLFGQVANSTRPPLARPTGVPSAPASSATPTISRRRTRRSSRASSPTTPPASSSCKRPTCR